MEKFANSNGMCKEDNIPLKTLLVDFVKPSSAEDDKDVGPAFT